MRPLCEAAASPLEFLHASTHLPAEAPDGAEARKISDDPVTSAPWPPAELGRNVSLLLGAGGQTHPCHLEGDPSGDCRRQNSPAAQRVDVSFRQMRSPVASACR